ncbi:hypothetical protein PR202_gb26663 [Eleusine coracana subsp. coracana]|uniref:Uncharacterized protein n=1 Tax=Eleusine coracana subsp. coracana TaxID=191504 RepID=A0AAV5FRT4_ELECO|nr:hypothetical protein PR202_gb26663 [Eleusine coracana subsp. coracana]
MAPAHPRLTAPTHPRPPAPVPCRPTAPPPPRPTAPPPPCRTASARQETPASIDGLRRKLVHDIQPPPQEPPPYEPPFGNATACDTGDDFNLTLVPLFD